MTKRILFIEDESDFATVVASYLQQNGFTVVITPSGEEGLDQLKKGLYDLVILDLGLPNIGGIDLCKKIRSKRNVPILILTARDEIGSKVRGLNAGADDYMVKPVSLKELLVRIERLLDRDLAQTFRSSVFDFAGVKFDTTNGVLTSKRQAVPLTEKERAVLQYFLLHQGQVLSRMEIMDHIWGNEIDLLSNTVSMVVSSLRRKLHKFSVSNFIHSIHGLGYKFEVGSG